MAFNYDWQQAAYLHPNQHCQFGAVVNFFLCDRISCDNHYYETIDGKTADITDEIPFHLPDNWAWCRIGTALFLQAGKFISANEIHEIEDEKHCYPCYGGNGKRGFVDRFNTSGEHPIIGRQGALCGNINFASGEFYSTEHAVVVDVFAKCSSALIALFLTALNLNQYSTATAQPGLSVNVINSLLFPLPPLTEQQQIVEQIETLLGYVDIIDTDAETLEKSITLAKQKILDLAIRGKLVPQDPTDEPASELLKKIKAEKEALVKAGKIKKDKHESFIFKGDDNCYYEQLNDKTIDITAEIPFDLPESWSWCRLYSVVEICDNLRKPINAEERQKRIKSANNLYPYYGATGQVGWIDDFISDGEFVLLGEDGAPFLDPCTPKAYIICGKAWVNNHAHVLKGINNQFLCHCLNSVDYTNFITGTTRYKLTQAEMVKILLPTPPLAEQQRIVQAIAQYNSILELISK